MKLKVTEHWDMSYNRPGNDPESIIEYGIELENKGPQWITEENVAQLKKDPGFRKLLEKNGYECSPATGQYLMENPMIAVVDKDKRIVFSVDYYGLTITHHKDHRDGADQITRLLLGESLIEADERYIAKSLKIAGLTLPNSD